MHSSKISVGGHSSPLSTSESNPIQWAGFSDHAPSRNVDDAISELSQQSFASVSSAQSGDVEGGACASVSSEGNERVFVSSEVLSQNSKMSVTSSVVDQIRSGFAHRAVSLFAKHCRGFKFPNVTLDEKKKQEDAVCRYLDERLKNRIEMTNAALCELGENALQQHPSFNKGATGFLLRRVSPQKFFQEQSIDYCIFHALLVGQKKIEGLFTPIQFKRYMRRMKDNMTIRLTTIDAFCKQLENEVALIEALNYQFECEDWGRQTLDASKQTYKERLKELVESALSKHDLDPSEIQKILGGLKIPDEYLKVLKSLICSSFVDFYLSKDRILLKFFGQKFDSSLDVSKNKKISLYQKILKKISLQSIAIKTANQDESFEIIDRLKAFINDYHLSRNDIMQSRQDHADRVNITVNLIKNALCEQEERLMEKYFNEAINKHKFTVNFDPETNSSYSFENFRVQVANALFWAYFKVLYYVSKCARMLSSFLFKTEDYAARRLFAMLEHPGNLTLLKDFIADSFVNQSNNPQAEGDIKQCEEKLFIETSNVAEVIFKDFSRHSLPPKLLRILKVFGLDGARMFRDLIQSFLQEMNDRPHFDSIEKKDQLREATQELISQLQLMIDESLRVEILLYKFLAPLNDLILKLGPQAQEDVQSAARELIMFKFIDYDDYMTAFNKFQELPYDVFVDELLGV